MTARHWIRTLVAALLGITSQQPCFAQGSAFVNTVSFRSPLELVIERNDHALDPSNDCASVPACAGRYRLEERDPYRTYDIASVSVSGPRLTAILTESPSTPKKLVFVATALKATPKIGYLEVSVTPQLMQLAVDETEAGEGLRAPVVVQYHALTPLTLDPASKKTRAAASASLTITDPADYDRPYRGYVSRMKFADTAKKVVEMTITGVPRGKKLNVQVGGLESFSAQPQQASTSIQSIAVPKGRDDATFYLKLSAETNDVKRERKYTLDTRMRDVWRAGERWNLGPTLDATFGNKTTKAPNSGAISFDARYFIPGGSRFRTNVTFSPIFRTDRSFTNEDLGIDIVAEGIIPALERPLEQRRKEEKRLGGPPLSRAWGWKVRPSIALETGRHIKSSAAEVDDAQFSRLRAGVSAALEYGRWSLTTSVQRRNLFNEEVLVQEGAVTAVSDAEKTYGRADLSYDLGVVALTLTHITGRQPPAFTATESTSLGLTFKF